VKDTINILKLNIEQKKVACMIINVYGSIKCLYCMMENIDFFTIQSLNEIILERDGEILFEFKEHDILIYKQIKDIIYSYSLDKLSTIEYD